jgi:serine/threonine protein kinase
MLADRYKILKEFKTGGFSQTFLARDLQHPEHQHCIIKKLRPKDDDAFTVRTARQLFTKEVNVLQKLGHHPQIPQLYTTFTDNEDFYLVEEFIVGHSVAREFRWGWHWSETKVLALLQNILSTLAFVHRQGVIHRDLKPENLIRRQRDQSIVLIDFGCIHDRHANPDAVAGTDGYMPVEQLEGHPRLSSDVYAVGMIALQALTGINPNRQAFSTHEQTGDLQWHRYRSTSPGLSHVVDRMVRCDVRQRYSSASEVLNAVNALIETFNASETSVPDRRRFLRAAGHGAMGLLGVGIALPALTPDPRRGDRTPLSVSPPAPVSPPPVRDPVSASSVSRQHQELSKSVSTLVPTPLDKAELMRRYGSYNECRKAAKARGIKFNCTPTWDKLAQAFGYSDAMQEISHRYMAAHPNASLSGIKVEVNL